MKGIDLKLPRLGADGRERAWSDIEKEFLALFKKGIKRRLSKITIKKSYPELKSFHTHLLRNMDEVLIGKPEVLPVWIRYWTFILRNLRSNFSKKRSPRAIEKNISSYMRKLTNAFAYKRSRNEGLNKIAVMINVKTCLYCNQNYTIVVGNSPDDKGNIVLDDSQAFIEFDHFFDKSSFPFLSMSLYNLIPACAQCNHKKSDNHYSLRLHPYWGDYASQLTFKIKDPDALTNPKFMKIDLMEVEIDDGGNAELGRLMRNLAIKERYSRHLDIVREIEIAKYLQPYYEKILSGSFMGETGCKLEKFDSESLRRYLYGFYNDEKDINKRPLSKFSQDMFRQF
ncbi:MAG: hypothetical protein K2J48_03860 [Muribaculaceae bacterium]|nr:hypothetical protein [Muribaculaceae bacterium]